MLKATLVASDVFPIEGRPARMIKSEGCKPPIFYYDIFPETIKTLSDHGVSLHYLCTWWDVLAEAKAQNAYDTGTLAEVEKFLNNPREWQEKRMGNNG